MKVGYNLLWLRPGDVGGSEQSVMRALTALADLGDIPGFSAHLFVTSAILDAHGETVQRFAGHSVCPSLDVGRQSALLNKMDVRVRRVSAENGWLRREAARSSLGIDAMHHLGGTIPMRFARSVPQHLTIHDVQPLDLPDNFGVLKRWYLTVALKTSVRRSTTISVPSNFVKRTVTEQFDVPGLVNKISVVPWGFPAEEPDSSHIRSSDGHRDLVEANRDFSEANSSGESTLGGASGKPYVIFPAAPWKHKHHADLIAAWDEVEHLDLVLTGKDVAEAGSVRSALNSSGARSRIHVAGRVPETELRMLYANAEFMVFPTSYEGFGLPIGEATAFGIPTLTTDIGVMDEFMPPSVPRLEAGEPDTWSQAINDFYRRRAEFDTWVREIRHMNSSLTWENTAKGWLRQYGLTPPSGETGIVDAP